jgi:hypothetical protein
MQLQYHLQEEAEHMDTGYIIYPLVYMTITPTAWIVPIKPGIQPVLPVGGTTAQINAVIQTFEEDQPQW